MKRKCLKAAGILLGVLLLTAVILLISGPQLQVVKKKGNSGENTYSVYIINFSLRMLYSGTYNSVIERWNGETWESCPMNPEIDNFGYPLAMWSLYPFERKNDGAGWEKVYDLSAEGRYRFVKKCGYDERNHDEWFEIVREFQVR